MRGNGFEKSGLSEVRFIWKQSHEMRYFDHFPGSEGLKMDKLPVYIPHTHSIALPSHINHSSPDKQQKE